MKFSIINGDKGLLEFKDKVLIENASTYTQLKDKDKTLKIFPINENLNVVYIRDQEEFQESIKKSLVINLKLDNNETKSLFLTFVLDRNRENILNIVAYSNYIFNFFNSDKFFRSFYNEFIEIYTLDINNQTELPLTYIFFKKVNWLIKLIGIAFIGIKNNFLIMTNYSKLFLIDLGSLQENYVLNIIKEYNITHGQLFLFNNLTTYISDFNNKEILLSDLNSNEFLFKYLDYISNTSYENLNKTTQGNSITPNYKGITILSDGGVVRSPEFDGSKEIEYFDKISIEGKIIGIPDLEFKYSCLDLTPNPIFVGDMKFFASPYVLRHTCWLYKWSESLQDWVYDWTYSNEDWNGNHQYKYYYSYPEIEFIPLGKTFVPVKMGEVLNLLGNVFQVDLVGSDLVRVTKPIKYIKILGPNVDFNCRDPEEGYYLFTSGNDRYRFYKDWSLTINYLRGTKAIIKYNHSFKLISTFNTHSSDFYMEFQDKDRNTFKYPLRFKSLNSNVSTMEQYMPFFGNLYGDRQYGGIISPIFGVRSKWDIFQLSEVDFYLKEFPDVIKAKGVCNYLLYIKDRVIQKEIYIYSDYSYTVHPFIPINYFVDKFIADLSLSINNSILDVLCLKLKDGEYYLQFDTENGTISFDLKTLTTLLQTNKIIPTTTKVKDIVSIDFYDNTLHFINKKDLKILKNIIKLI